MTFSASIYHNSRSSLIVEGDTLRIGFDASSTRGQKTGIGIYTENLLRTLREIAPHIEFADMDDGATANQRVPFRIFREQFSLPRLAERYNIALLHLTGFGAPYHAPCPIVLTIHDLIGVLFSHHFPPVARLYWSRYLPFTLRFASHLIVPSQSAKNDITRLTHVPPDRVHVIPYGRDERFRVLADKRALEQTRHLLDLPQQFILFVSTLEPRKGVDTLIRAFFRVAQDIPHDLVIVGKRGWYWQEIFNEITRLGLEKRVRIVDYVSHERLPEVYNLARAFVFPSRYEGFGLPPLEAMACGSPVISTNVSSLPEVVGDAGILLAPEDVDGFASAIARAALDDSLYDHLRLRGLQQATKFSWERAARDTISVYEFALDKLHHE